MVRIDCLYLLSYQASLEHGTKGFSSRTLVPSSLAAVVRKNTNLFKKYQRGASHGTGESQTSPKIPRRSFPLVRIACLYLLSYQAPLGRGTGESQPPPKIPRKMSRGVTAGHYNSNYLLWFDPPLRADPKTSFYLLLRVFFDLLPMVTIGRTI